MHGCYKRCAKREIKKGGRRIEGELCESVERSGKNKEQKRVKEKKRKKGKKRKEKGYIFSKGRKEVLREKGERKKKKKKKRGRRRAGMFWSLEEVVGYKRGKK